MVQKKSFESYQSVPLTTEIKFTLDIMQIYVFLFVHSHHCHGVTHHPQQPCCSMMTQELCRRWRQVLRASAVVVSSAAPCLWSARLPRRWNVRWVRHLEPESRSGLVPCSGSLSRWCHPITTVSQTSSLRRAAVGAHSPTF